MVNVNLACNTFEMICFERLLFSSFFRWQAYSTFLDSNDCSGMHAAMIDDGELVSSSQVQFGINKHLAKTTNCTCPTCSCNCLPCEQCFFSSMAFSVVEVVRVAALVYCRHYTLHLSWKKKHFWTLSTKVNLDCCILIWIFAGNDKEPLRARKEKASSSIGRFVPGKKGQIIDVKADHELLILFNISMKSNKYPWVFSVGEQNFNVVGVGCC